MKTMKDQLKKWTNKEQSVEQPEKLTDRDLRYTGMKTLRRGKGGAYK